MTTTATAVFKDAAQKVTARNESVESEQRKEQLAQSERKKTSVARIEKIKIKEFLANPEMLAVREKIVARGGLFEEIRYDSWSQGSEEGRGLRVIQLTEPLEKYHSAYWGGTRRANAMLLVCSNHEPGFGMYEILDGREHPFDAGQYAFVEAMCAFHKIEIEDVIPLIRQKLLEVANLATKAN